MTTAIRYAGDAILPPLPPQGDEVAQPVTCLIWGADLTGLGRGRDLRHALHAHAEAAFSAAQAHGAVRHLVIAYRCAPHLCRRLRTPAHSASRRVHAALERERARDVDVFMIDITELDDGDLAEHRFAELATQRAGVAGYAAVSWSDIRDQPIQTAAKQDLV